MPKVLIGVQARSTSTRLPGKSLEMIDTQTMTDHVLRACDESADHLNRRSKFTDIECIVAILVPFNDDLIDYYKQRQNAFPRLNIVHGPEHDVMGRYAITMAATEPDYLCRITADCPLISPAIITKHIATAINHQIDYCANVYESARTYIDGFDVEVISAKLFQWMCEREDLDDSHREHVTTYLREHRPRWAKYGAVIGHVDLSQIKYSVDTKTELQLCRENKKSVMEKIKAMKNDGISIFRF